MLEEDEIIISTRSIGKAKVWKLDFISAPKLGLVNVICKSFVIDVGVIPCLYKRLL